MNRRLKKKELTKHIRIKNILFFENGNHSEIRKLVKKEFYCQLKKAVDRFGKPHFARSVTIYITEDSRCFNSKDSYVAFQKDCINWKENKIKWELQDALSHELVHLIFGQKPNQPYNPASVLEEGLAYYHTTKEYTWLNYEKMPRVLDAISYIEEALQQVPDLLTKWRTGNGSAPVIQMLSDDDLKKLGIEDTLRFKLLENFVY